MFAKYYKEIAYGILIVWCIAWFLSEPIPTLGQALRVVTVPQGGTGTSTAPALDQLLIGNGSGGYTFIDKTSLGGSGGGGGGFPTYFQNGGATLNTATTTVNFTANSFSVVENPTDTLTIRVSTTTLGLLTTNVSEGSNLYYTDARVSSYLWGSSTVVLASTTRATNWDTAFSWGNHASQGYITDGNTNWDNIYGLLTSVDISANTNLTGDTEVVLTGDALSLGNTLSYTYGSTTGFTSTNLYSTDASSTNASSSVLNVARLIFGGVAGTAWSDFCTSITGSASLCDGSDATGGGGGGGSISTSTVPVTSNLAYWTSDSSLSDVATGTLTETVSGLSFDATRGLVGGPAVLSLDSGFTIPSTTRAVNWDTAFGWGNHASQGYITDGNTNWDNSYGFLTTVDISANTNLSGDTEVVLTGDSLSLGNNLSFTYGSTTGFTASNLYAGSLNGMLKGVSGLVSTASNGTDYTLISGTTCTGSDKVSAISASGAVTCSADQTGGGGGVSDWRKNTALDAITPTTTVGIVVNASSTISDLNIPTSINLFGGGAKTTANDFCIQLTGSADLCDGVDGGGGGSSKWTDGGLFTYLTDTADDVVLGSTDTSTAPFWFDVSANTLLIGSASSADSEVTFGPLATSYTAGYDATDGYFKIATGTALGTADVFTLFGTSTGLLATTTNGMLETINLVAQVGSRNYNQTNSLLPLDSLNINGPIDQGTWVTRECVAPMQASINAAALSADSANACGDFMFQEDTTATIAMLTTGGWGGYYNQIMVANNLPNDGGGLFLFGGLSFASNTPIFKAVARIATPANASNTQMFLGFTDLNPSATTYDIYPGGCMFVASSTNANWQAYCGTGAGTKTFVDTGVPTTTSQTANAGRFYRFSIYADANRVRFYIATPTQSQKLVAEMENVQPVGSIYNVGTYFATNLGGGGSRGLDVKYISLSHSIGI